MNNPQASGIYTGTGKLLLSLAAVVSLSGCASVLPKSPIFAKDTVATFHHRIAQAKRECGPGQSVATNTSCYLTAVQPWWENPEPGRAEAEALRLPESIPTVPKVEGLSAEAAMQKLCDMSAGDFVIGAVADVQGFIILRPRREITDYELTNLYALEDPAGYSVSGLSRIEEYFRPLGKNSSKEPARAYSVVETFDTAPIGRLSAKYYDKSLSTPPAAGEVVAQFSDTTRKAGSYPYLRKLLPAPTQRFGITWRGIEPTSLRELGISGSELLIVDREDGDKVLAVRRNFYLVRAAQVPEKTGLHWSIAHSCPQISQPRTGWKIRSFVSKVLKPMESK